MQPKLTRCLLKNRTNPSLIPISDEDGCSKGCSIGLSGENRGKKGSIPPVCEPRCEPRPLTDRSPSIGTVLGQAEGQLVPLDRPLAAALAVPTSGPAALSPPLSWDDDRLLVGEDKSGSHDIIVPSLFAQWLSK